MGVDRDFVELNVCPSCDAFVRGSWSNCRACGHELASNDQQLEEDAAVSPVLHPATHPVLDPATHPVLYPATHPAAAEIDTPAAQSQPAWSSEQVEWPEPEAPAEWSDDHVVEAPQPEPQPELQAEVESPEAPSAQFETFSWDESAEFSTQPPAQFSTQPPARAEVSDEEPWADDLMLRPIQLAFKAPQHSTEALFASESIDGEMEDGRLRPALSRNAIIALAAGGLAIPILLVVVLIGAVAFLGSNASTSQDKLVTVKNAPAAQAHGQSSNITAPPQWIDYRDPDGLFNIQFPSQPTVTSQVVGGDKISVYSCATDNGNGVAQVVTQATPPGDQAAVLLQAMQNDAAFLNANLTSHSITTQNSRLQISAQMTTPTGNAINAIAFVQGRTLYTLLVVSADSSGDPSLFGHLSSTFVPTSS